MKKFLKRFLLFSFLILPVAAGFFLWFFSGFHFLRPNGNFLFKAAHSTFFHLDFYTDKLHYQPGQNVVLFASSRPEGEVKIKGWNLFSAEEMWFDTTLNVLAQLIGDSVSFSGANWNQSLSLKAPHSGWWVIEASKGNRNFRQSVFIRDSQAAPASILYMIPTNTWNAYNTWGGKSLYSPKPYPAYSFSRPCLPADPAMKDIRENYPYYYQSPALDTALIHFLKSAGYSVDFCTDGEWDEHPEILLPYSTLIIGNHSEYWTGNMYSGLDSFLRKGGSFLSLSGNLGFWYTEIDYTKNQMRVIKKDENSWMLKQPSLASLTGIYSSLESMQTYAPFEVMAENDSFFSGTGLRNGDLIGLTSRSVDRSAFHEGEPLWKDFLFPGNPRSAGSGLEFDRVNSNTPTNWVTLARGINPNNFGKGQVFPDPAAAWYRDGGAELGYYRHPGGGIVFNAGSVTFPGCVPEDSIIQKLILNVLKRTAPAPEF